MTQPIRMTTSQILRTYDQDPGQPEDSSLPMVKDPGQPEESSLPVVKDPGPASEKGPGPPAEKAFDIPVEPGPEEDKPIYRINIQQKVLMKPGPAAITKQPQAADSLGALKTDSMVHPSLRKLKDQERITIQQKCSNYCLCCIMNSSYRVKDAKGNPMFDIREESSTAMRCCCCWCRSFVMKILDMDRKEMMLLKRPVTCGQCYLCCGNYCLPCCLNDMEVSGSQSPYRNFGRVVQNFSCFTPSFTCLNDVGQPAFNVTGSCCRMPFTSHNFRVVSAGKGVGALGNIRRVWTTCMTECCTNAHKWDIRFEKNTTVEDRIMMLSAAILIDFLYYT